MVQKNRLNRQYRNLKTPGGKVLLEAKSHGDYEKIGRNVSLNMGRGFLNRFSDKDLWNMIIEGGLPGHLAEMGYSVPCFEFGFDEAFIHHLRIYNKKVSADNLLVDLRISEARYFPEEKYFLGQENFSGFNMLYIEWLSLENPGDKFSKKRPRLPGQRKPGLNALGYIIDLIKKISGMLMMDGFLDLPDYIHGAIMYSRYLKFFNPEDEGVLRALIRDLRQYSLEDITWGVITKTIIDMTKDKPYRYRPSEQLYIDAETLRAYFDSREYAERFNDIYMKKSYWLDFRNMQKLKKEILKNGGEFYE